MKGASIDIQTHNGLSVPNKVICVHGDGPSKSSDLNLIATNSTVEVSKVSCVLAGLVDKVCEDVVVLSDLSFNSFEAIFILANLVTQLSYIAFVRHDLADKRIERRCVCSVLATDSGKCAFIVADPASEGRDCAFVCSRCAVQPGDFGLIVTDCAVQGVELRVNVREVSVEASDAGLVHPDLELERFDVRQESSEVPIMLSAAIDRVDIVGVVLVVVCLVENLWVGLAIGSGRVGVGLRLGGVRMVQVNVLELVAEPVSEAWLPPKRHMSGLVEMFLRPLTCQGDDWGRESGKGSDQRFIHFKFYLQVFAPPFKCRICSNLTAKIKFN